MTTPPTTPTPEQDHDQWDRIATGFDRYATPLTMSLAEEALGRVNLRPGMRFLDVAGGSGALSIPAARAGAEVLATDISPTMVARLEARAREEGLTRLEGRRMDGTALELEDDVFDVAGSQNGVSLFPDLKRGLRELVRVTRPGGQVLIVAFGPPKKAEYVSFLIGALQASIPGFTGLPTDPPPLSFQVADPGTLRREMAGAGLADVRVATTTWKVEVRSARHYWNAVTNSNPIPSALVADLTEEQTTEVLQVLEGMLRERAEAGSAAVLKSEMNIGIGVK